MTHVAPSVYTLWSILSTLFFGFLISHLWKFDRFESLKWRSNRNKGAFKRVMTFTYLLGLPCIMVYSIGMMVIKYQEGYVDFPGFGIIPTPYILWSPTNRSLVLKLVMFWAVAWGLEIVTHLEELCFWLFLMNAGGSHVSWFSSIYFKLWAVGSVVGLTSIPLVTWFTRSDPLTSEAYTLLVGSSASLLITLGGLRIVWTFPAFLHTVRSAGAEPEVVVRLTTFHDVNVMRIIFRFVFTVPAFILAVDGVHGHHHPINDDALWTDFLAALVGIGLIMSSCLTLLIFFPRSIEREAGYRPKKSSNRTAPLDDTTRGGQPIANTAAQLQQARSQFAVSENPFAATGIAITTDQSHDEEVGFHSKTSLFHHQNPSDNPVYPPNNGSQPYLDRSGSVSKRQEVWEMVTNPVDLRSDGAIGFNPHENTGTIPIGMAAPSSTRLVPTRPPRPDIHPMLMNYSSPINLHDGEDAQRPARRLHRPQNAI